ncbi:MAG: ATP-binding cassette domain-containing protein [Caldilineaceae bacterium]
MDLRVRPGEMVAVMGPSGCGKTTMLNCISGLDESDSGEILIEGQDLRNMGDRRRTDYRARRGLHLPDLQPAARHHRGGKCGTAAAGERCAPGRRASAPWPRWTRSGWPTGPATVPRNCRAGSASA